MSMRCTAMSRSRPRRRLARCFQPGEAGEGAAVAAVARRGVFLEDGAACKGTRKFSGIEVREEVAVAGTGNTGNGAAILFGDGPADVVVAADIGGPASVAEALRKMRGQHMGHQRGVAAGERRPVLHHEIVVIGEIGLAACVAALPQIRHQITWRDDGLRLVDQRGCGNAGGRAERLQNVVHLGLVLAVGAEALPHEGHGIETQNVDAPVGEIQHHIDNFEEDLRVRPVQVPLVFVEGGPDPFAEVGYQVKLPGASAGKISTSVFS